MVSAKIVRNYRILRRTGWIFELVAFGRPDEREFLSIHELQVLAIMKSLAHQLAPQTSGCTPTSWPVPEGVFP